MARSSDDLPEPTGPTTSTNCPRSTVRSMSRAPTRAVLVHRGEPPPASSWRSGLRGAVDGRRRGAGRDVHARHRGRVVAPTPAIATVRRVHTRAEGSCETSDAVVQANQRAAPSVATATSVAAGREAAAQVERPRADRQQAADQRRGGPGQHLGGDLAALPVAADPVEAGQVGQHRPGRAGQLDRAGGRQRRHQRGGERRPGRHGPARPTAPAAARTRSRPAPETTIVARKNSAGTNDRDTTVIDDQQEDADELVDQVVGQLHHPLGVAGLGHHLGRGVLADPARAGLAVHQPQADAQHLPDPPLGEPLRR